MKRSCSAVGCVLLVTLVACKGTQPEANVPKLEPISVSPPAESLTPPPPTSESDTPGEAEPFGTVVFEHDFSSPAGGLLGEQASDAGTNTYGTRSAEYTAQGTLLVRTESDLDTYVGGASTQDVTTAERGPLDNLQDVSIEVDATPLRIGSGANWGLACRRDRQSGSFYFAFVGEDGGQPQAGIIRQDQPGGDWIPVVPASPLPDGVLIGEGKTSRLRLDCLGSRLTLFVDGHRVAEGTDPTLGLGAVALFVNPLVISAEVEFDNLVIRAS